MIIKSCPSCSKPLPLISGNNHICKYCNTKLTSRHGGIVLAIIFVLLFVPFKLASTAALMQEGTLNTILIFSGIFITAFIIRYFVISYKIDKGDGA